MTASDHDSVRSAGLRHRGITVAAAMAIANVAVYAYAMVAARALGPQAYGAFASLLAVLLVVSVLQLGIQATAARRIAAEPDHVAQIEHEVMTLTYRTSVVVGVVLLLLAPALDALLRLDSLPAACLVGLSAVPTTIVGGQLGILQGERRWWPLSAVYIACGLPRLLLGAGLVLWRPDELTAMTGVFLGSVVPVVLGAYVLRREREVRGRVEHHSTRAIAREMVSNSQALLAFLALVNCDVIIARTVLPDHDAGLYAGGLILTKAMLFLPQFVVVVAFPSMSTSAERAGALLRSLGLVLALGVLGVLGSALLPRLALVFVGGDAYAEIDDRLWLYAVLGTVLSLVQLLVYAVLARQGTRSVLLVWAALLVVLVAASQADSLLQLLLTVLAVDSALFVVLLAVSLHRLREPVTGDVPPPEPVL